MYKKIKALGFGLIAVLLFALTACEHENYVVPKPNEHIRPAGDFIKNNYDFRLFHAALEYTGLAGELNGPGPFTVFALPDVAFNGLGVHTVEQVRNLDKDSLAYALRLHILKNRRLTFAAIPTRGVDIQYETLNGDKVYVSVNSANIYVDGAYATRRDIVLSNGVLHVMDKAIKYYKGKKVTDYLSEAPEYSIFVSALKKFGMWQELVDEKPVTIFAPNNTGFNARGITQTTIDTMTVAAYHAERFLGMYILHGRHFFLSDIFVTGSGRYESFLRNDDWKINWLNVPLTPANMGSLYNPEIRSYKIRPGATNYTEVGYIIATSSDPKPVTWFDHLCENGVVHQVQGVLAMPQDALK
jgi:uncharacterized surface protein with fasciclin (FAS1) repeats